MQTQPNVLAITRRSAHLCATQSLLYAAGYKLVVATNVSAARRMISSLRVKAVIVCAGSWSSAEVQEIASELIQRIKIPVLMRCPGCDEVAGKPGTLRDTAPLTNMIAAIERPT